jgi:hypothetical protein
MESSLRTLKKIVLGQMWRLMLAIPAHGRLRQEDLDFEDSWATKRDLVSKKIVLLLGCLTKCDKTR